MRMKIRLSILVVLAGLAGCVNQSLTGDVRVPYDAEMVCYGKFPTLFVTSPSAGSVYVVDDQTKAVVWMFNVPTATPVQTQFSSLPDDAKATFDPGKVYRVYFSPKSAPAGGK